MSYVTPYQYLPNAYRCNSCATSDNLISEMLILAQAYDDLLAAYGRPFAWGKVTSDNARALVAFIRANRS